MADGQNPAPDAPADADPATEAPATEAPSTGDPQESETPPWGDDFDPARAWKTIQTLRESEKELKRLKAEQERAEKEREDAEKTEIERLSEERDRLKAELAARDREALVAKVAKDHGIPEDLVEFLTADTEEALVAQAERLGSKVKTAPADDLPGKPKPRLTPGTGSDDGVPSETPEEIAKRIRAVS